MSKKGSKKATPQAQETIDDATLNLLVNQKLKEFGVASEDDKEVKRLRKKYYPISKAGVTTIYPGLDDNAKLAKLVEAYNQLTELNSFFEEHNYILDRHQGQIKAERDLLQGDLTKLSGLKSNFEKFARDVQKNNAQIKDINKKFVEEETAKREEIMKSFENTINEISLKLDEQRLQAQEQIQENDKLKAEFDEKIKVYEAREREFFEQVKVLDSANDDKTKGVLGNLKDIEDRARKAFEIKDQINAIKRQETEDKLKIAVYSQRFGDLDTTFGNTLEVLRRFKEELLRSGTKVKALYKENQELKEKNEKLSNYSLDLFYLKEDNKKKIEQSLKEKNALKAKCLAIQNEIVAKNKQIQELENK